MPRPQFRLRSLFILTAIVAVGCLVGPIVWRLLPPVARMAIWQDDQTINEFMRERFYDAPVQASPPNN
ncbi:MAG TPA: hypothetical protein VND64_29905 [Pirellulales bacterium]|nr:hypothetical protein [Pirellulales bacterium]